MTSQEEIETSPENASDEEYRNFKEDPGDDDGENRHPLVYNSIIKTAFMTVKCIIGAGILNLPYIFRTFGLVGGIILSIFMNFLTELSTLLLLRCKDITQRYSYAVYTKFTMGKTGMIITKLAITIFFFACCCVQLKVFGDLLRTLLMIVTKNNVGEEFYYNAKLLSIVVAILIIPLAFQNDISGITKYTYVGVSCLGIFYFTTIGLFIQKITKNSIKFDDLTEKKYLFGEGKIMQMFTCFGAYFNAVTYQINVFPMYLPLKPRSSKNFMKATILGSVICVSIYVTFGIVGFLMYRNIDDSLIIFLEKDLKGFSENNEISMIVMLVINHLAFIVNVAFSCIMAFFLCKKQIIGSIKFAINKYRESKEEENQKMIELEETGAEKVEKKDEEDILSNKKQLLISVLSYIVIVYFAVTSDKIVTLDNFNGSTMSNYLYCVLPGVFYLYFWRKKPFNFLKLLSVFVIIIGVVLISGFVLFNILHFKI